MLDFGEEGRKKGGMEVGREEGSIVSIKLRTNPHFLLNKAVFPKMLKVH